jgi:serine/threonine-protein kinase
MPDGRSVMFASNRSRPGLYRRAADGTGSDTLVLTLPQGIYEGAWSADGRWLLARLSGTLGQVGGRDIVAYQPGADSTARPVLASAEFDEKALALSPDGRWLAYESNESGRDEVYLRPFPNVEAGRWQVSTVGGVAPIWSRNGRELFYVNPAREMVVVPVAPGPEPRLGERRVLFRLRDELYLADRENYTPYDIGPDGRFIMARRLRSAALTLTPPIVVYNWFEEVRERLARR